MYNIPEYLCDHFLLVTAVFDFDFVASVPSINRRNRPKHPRCKDTKAQNHSGDAEKKHVPHDLNRGVKSARVLILAFIRFSNNLIFIINSPQFGRVMAVCVDATLFGSMKTTVHEGDQVQRGQEFGCCPFGESYILRLCISLKANHYY